MIKTPEPVRKAFTAELIQIVSEKKVALTDKEISESSELAIELYTLHIENNINIDGIFLVKWLKESHPR